MALSLTRSSQWPVCSPGYEKNTHLIGFYPIHSLIAIQFSTNINVHTGNHVYYVYLGTNDTKTNQNCKLTDANTGCIHY